MIGAQKIEAACSENMFRSMLIKTEGLDPPSFQVIRNAD
jgi:hypothetical protein